MSARLRCAVVSIVFLLAACGGGETDGNNGSNIVSNNQIPDGGSPEVTTDDSGQSGFNNLFEGCESVECDDGFRCVRGACVPDEAPVACERPVDLGMLDPGSDTLSATGDTTDFVDSTTTQCGSIGPFSGAENAFAFTVASAATLNLELTTDAPVDWVMEVRRGNCFDRESRVVCSDPETTSFAVEPGETYFLIVEPAMGIDKGAFEVAGSFTAGVCSPPGSRRCSADQEIAVCFGGEEELLYDCTGMCNNGACAGNDCSSTLEVTSSTTLTGNSRAYENNFDLDEQPSCSPDGNDGIGGPGGDFVVSLPGLSAGQTVVFDGSEDFVDQVFYLLDSCATDTTCAVGVDLTDRLEFTTDAAGDYFVLVDVASGRGGEFEIEVTIQ